MSLVPKMNLSLSFEICTFAADACCFPQSSVILKSLAQLCDKFDFLFQFEG